MFNNTCFISTSSRGKRFAALIYIRVSQLSIEQQPSDREVEMNLRSVLPFSKGPLLSY
jgi:hypothetical protein